MSCHFSDHAVWGNADALFRAAVAAHTESRTVPKGEQLTLAGQLCLLQKGRAAVTVKGGGRTAMKELHAGEVFGAALLFGGEAVSNIVARSDCRIELLSEAFLTERFSSDPAAALGYIRFLSDRVRFLSRRIGELSGGDPEERLLDYLMRRAENRLLKMPMTRLAAELGIGRTTLYRTLDALERSGRIRRTDAGILFLKKG